MRLQVSLEADELRFDLPIHYNHVVQSSIYSVLDPVQGTFLHDHGFRVGARVFKGFTFSRLLGRFDIRPEAGTITFTGPVRLVIASPFDEFCNILATRLLDEGVARLGRTNLHVLDITAQRPEITSETVVVRTLSPVVAYSTLLKADGTRYTCYYQPGEPEFAELVSANLQRKAQILGGVAAEVPFRPVSVRPLAQPRMSVIQYKGTVIKGYSARLRLEGPIRLLQLALDAGLGSKNSQGFGCLEMVPKEGFDADREPDKARTASPSWRPERRGGHQANHRCHHR